jgi:hypothetical protein
VRKPSVLRFLPALGSRETKRYCRFCVLRLAGSLGCQTRRDHPVPVARVGAQWPLEHAGYRGGSAAGPRPLHPPGNAPHRPILTYRAARSHSGDLATQGRFSMRHSNLSRISPPKEWAQDGPPSSPAARSVTAISGYVLGLLTTWALLPRG